jgi:hypothetical protein
MTARLIKNSMHLEDGKNEERVHKSLPVNINLVAALIIRTNYSLRLGGMVLMKRDMYIFMSCSIVCI